MGRSVEQWKAGSVAGFRVQTLVAGDGFEPTTFGL
jgi:hypothetical protein